MEKFGNVREGETLSDFNTKKAAYYDADGELIADEDNKDKLTTPVPLKELTE